MVPIDIAANPSQQLIVYSNIYYSGLYASDSKIIGALINFLAAVGIAYVIVIVAIHLCAILRAYFYLYKNQPSDLHYHIPDTTGLSKLKPFGYLPPQIRTECSHASDESGDFQMIPGRLKTLKEEQVIAHIEPPMTITLPGVSIIKPLAGIDVNIETNLTSYFRINYPTYEILFCITDPHDPVLDIIHRLLMKYPHVDARSIFVKDLVGINPKVNNLQAGFDVAQYELILTSDSGIWTSPNSLRDMVDLIQADKTIGMVHQLPFILPLEISYFQRQQSSSSSDTTQSERQSITIGERPSITWILQLVFFGSWFSKIYIPASFFNINCVTGMSILLRKSILDSVGGFKMFGCYLAEDHFLAKYFLNCGWKIQMSHQPAWQNSPSPSLKLFYERIMRWTKLRFTMAFPSYLLEPLTHSFTIALFGALSFHHLLPELIDPGVYFLCQVLLCFLLDYILILCVSPPHQRLSIYKWECLGGWLLMEVLAVPIHILAAFKREIRWRDKRFRLRCGGMLERVNVAKETISSRPVTKDQFIV